MARSDVLSVALALLGTAAGLLLGGTTWGVVLLAIGIVCLVIWHGWRDHNRGTLSWTHLEARFKELRQKELQHASSNSGDGRLEATQNRDTNGVHSWALMGSNRRVRADADRLFALAGKKLRSSGLASSPRLQHEKDHVGRWLWYVVEIGDHVKDTTATSVTREAGRIETHTYWLRDVLDESIAGCVECLKREAV